jgi:hypothetical protein
VHELGRSPPVNANELFNIATSFASREEAVGAIFNDKKGKHSEDTPVEGSGHKDSPKKQKQGERGKKPQRTVQAQERGEDDHEVHVVNPTHKGPQGPLEVLACSKTC